VQGEPRPVRLRGRASTALLLGGLVAVSAAIVVADLPHLDDRTPPDDRVTAGETTTPGAARRDAATAEPVPDAVRPIRPTVHTLAVPAGHRGTTPRVPARPVRRFSLVGLTWSDPRVGLTVPVQVRARSTNGHRWGPWTDLAPSDDATEARGPVRGGTVGVWVGDSDGVEWRVRGVLEAPLPEGVRLDLVDPGLPDAPEPSRSAPATFVVEDDETPAGTAAASTTATGSSTTSTTTGTAAVTPTATLTPTVTANPPPSTPTRTPPVMVGRAGWGADEALRRAAPQYADTVKVVFIHHTASSNTYACSQSAAVIRSLYAYHTLSLGWNDIGYNFLVDRCGTLFEGRYGGAARPVVGAHTFGFNTGTAGIAVIGTFTSRGVPPEVLRTLARVTAWKLSLGGLGPSAVTTLRAGATDRRFTAGTSYPFHTVSGHRDGFATECPGAALYAQLPALRALATSDTSVLAPALTITGATLAGDRYYTTGRVGISWTPATPASDVTGYAVLVDDRLVTTTAPTTRSVALTLSPGTHRVALRTTFRATPSPTTTTPTTTTPGTDQAAAATSGATSGATSSPSTDPPTGTAATGTAATGTAATGTAATGTTVSAVIVADTRPPAFTSAPTLGLRSGTVNATGVPVILSWRVRDDNQLSRLVATSPTAARFAATSTNWATVAGPGPRRFALTAEDAAGNTASAATTGRAALVPETAATRSGGWSRTLNSSHDGGAALSSTAKNAALTWTFNGRGIALVATRTKWSGQARLYLDGVAAGTVDLKSSFTSFRQAVWVRNGLKPGPHTIRVVVVGTTRRPTIIVDGVAVLA
jgi:hypothetical protein